MKKSVIIIIALLLAAALVSVAVFVIVPKQKYQKATELLESGEFDAAAEAFAALEDYSDSAVMVNEAHYRKGAACLNKGDFDMAIELFTNLADYADSTELLNESKYQKAQRLIVFAEYKNAYRLLTELGDYDKAPESRDELVRLWAELALDCGKTLSFPEGSAQTLADYYKDYETIYEGLAAELVSTVEGSEAEHDIIHSTVTSYIDSLGEFSYFYRRENTKHVDIAHALMKALPASYMGEPEIRPYVAADNEYMYIEILGGDVNAPEGIRIDARMENRSTQKVWLVLQLPKVNGLVVEERNYCDLLPGQKTDMTIILPKDELGGSEAGPITGICFEYDGIGPDVDGDLYGDSVETAEVEIYPYGVYWYEPYQHEPEADDTVVFDGEYSDFIITDCGFNEDGDYELGFWVSNMYGNLCIGEYTSLKVNGIEVEPDPFLIYYEPFSTYYDEIIIPIEELQAKGIDQVMEIELSFAIQEWPEEGVAITQEAPTLEAALAKYGQEAGTVTIKPVAAA